MEIEEQVLSIEQVNQLQELGFEVTKYSSMCWINGRLFVKNDETTRALCLTEKYIPAMTIGDIIDILPIEIDVCASDMNRKYVSYSNNKIGLYFSSNRRRFIDSLFDCLVWCIKENIELLK